MALALVEVERKVYKYISHNINLSIAYALSCRVILKVKSSRSLLHKRMKARVQRLAYAPYDVIVLLLIVGQRGCNNDMTIDDFIL